MVNVEDAVIARLEIGGSIFEVLVDPETVQKLKDGKEVNIPEGLASDTIFKDAKKGERASEINLMKIFNTNNVEQIAKQIILKGEVQLTTEQRRKMQESKRRQIVAAIAKNAINPQTGTPHPPQRIELAMEEAKVRIDPFKPVEQQMNEVLDALRPLIPIKFDKIKIAVKLSGENYSRTYGDLKAFGKLLKEEWQSNGSWIGLVEIPAGIQNEFYERLNERTKGNVETKIIK